MNYKYILVYAKTCWTTRNWCSTDMPILSNILVLTMYQVQLWNFTYIILYNFHNYSMGLVLLLCIKVLHELAHTIMETGKSTICRVGKKLETQRIAAIAIQIHNVWLATEFPLTLGMWIIVFHASLQLIGWVPPTLQNAICCTQSPPF